MESRGSTGVLPTAYSPGYTSPEVLTPSGLVTGANQGYIVDAGLRCISCYLQLKAS